MNIDGNLALSDCSAWEKPAANEEWASELFYVLTDHLGTPQALTDENQTVVWRASYDPFGQATVDEDPDQDGNTITNNLRFPGQFSDEETGLHYNRWRYYDPVTGRYNTSDPIGILRDYRDPALRVARQAITSEFFVEPDFDLNHLYGYANQNPVNAVDSDGLYWMLVVKVIRVAGQLKQVSEWVWVDEPESPDGGFGGGGAAASFGGECEEMKAILFQQCVEDGKDVHSCMVRYRDYCDNPDNCPSESSGSAGSNNGGFGGNGATASF